MADKPLSERSFAELASAILRAVDLSLPTLRALTDADATRPMAAGKWSCKQTLGHLVDSASNNHQRFVRAQGQDAFQFSGYRQEHWVAVQRYDDRAWHDIVTLWASFNRHLAHVVEHIPEAHGSTLCVIGDNAPVTLRFLVDDYVVHLHHHADQIRAVALESALHPPRVG